MVSTNGIVQQVQTANKFAILEVPEGEKNENTELVLVEESNEQSGTTPNPKTTEKLNPEADVFKPNSLALTKSKTGGGNAETGGSLNESTVQWVTRTFGGNLATNVTTDMSKDNATMQLTGNTLWCDQFEEVLEDGGIPKGVTDKEEAIDEDGEEEEQRVNGERRKSNADVVSINEELTGRKEIEEAKNSQEP